MWTVDNTNLVLNRENCLDPLRSGNSQPHTSVLRHTSAQKAVLSQKRGRKARAEDHQYAGVAASLRSQTKRMRLLMALQAAYALRSAALRSVRRARTTLRATPDEWALPPGWAAALHDEIASDRHRALRAFVAAERNSQEVYPPPGDTLAALRAVDLTDVEVVIVGQDPYPGKNQAHGLCFSVSDLSQCVFPPSLRNVLREASRASEDWPEHPDPAKRGDLSRWASSQGVLLLNSVLTVRRGAANSHANQGWEEFTDAVVKAVAERERGVVFALWGNAAKRKVSNNLGGQHRVVSTSHPSPLSAAKGRDAFMGSDCFSRINLCLTELGRRPVRGPA